LIQVKVGTAEFCLMEQAQHSIKFTAMKSILVPIGGSTTDGPVLETALAAARPFAAHLQFLHIRVGLGETAQNTPHLAFASGAALRGALEELEVQTKGRCAAAVEHIHDFCTRSQIELCDAPNRLLAVTASCREEAGGALERVLFHARHNDLVVVGRASKPNGLPPDFLEHLLMGCGRPVLIAGPAPSPTVTGTIMVCWRESADAARALTAAAPFLAEAKRVVFAGVVERGRRIGPRRCCRSICVAWRSGRDPSHHAERPPGAGTAGERRQGLRRRSDRVGGLRSLAPARGDIRRLYPVLHPPLRSTGLVDALGVGPRSARVASAPRRPAPRPQQAYG
jgi:hypothetical protein